MAKIKDKYASNIVGHWDMRRGDLSDQSANANDGSFSDTPYWTNSPVGRGLRFDNADDAVSIAGSTVYCPDASAWSVFITYTKPDAENATRSLLKLRSDGDNPWELAFANTAGYNGILTGALTTYAERDTNEDTSGLVGTHRIGVSYNGSGGETAANTSLYFDGSSKTTAATGVFASKAQESIIGAQTTGTNKGNFNGIIHEVIIFNVELTAAEQAQLYEESLEEAHLAHIPVSTKLPQLAAFNEFEQDSTWTKGTGWTIDSGKASSDGSQVAVSGLTQDIGTVGEVYTIEYEVSGRTAGTVTGLAGTATGTSRSTNGVYTDVITATSTGLLGVQADADFIGNIEWVKIGSTPRIDLYATGQDWNITQASESTDFLSNTDFQINSGTWDLEDNSDGSRGKQISNATAGVIYKFSNQAYGTWEFDVYKNLTANVMDIMFVADTIGGGATGGQDGYGVRFDSDDTIALIESTAGVVSDHISSGSQSTLAWHTVKVTRTTGGSFELFIDDTSIGTASDTTTTTSTYLSIDLDANDAVRNFRFSPEI